MTEMQPTESRPAESKPTYDTTLLLGFLRQEFDAWLAGKELRNFRGAPLVLGLQPPASWMAPAWPSDVPAATDLFVAFADAYLAVVPVVSNGHDGGRACLVLQDGRKLHLTRPPAWHDAVTPALNITGVGH